MKLILTYHKINKKKVIELYKKIINRICIKKLKVINRNV